MNGTTQTIWTDQRFDESLAAVLTAKSAEDRRAWLESKPADDRATYGQLPGDADDLPAPELGVPVPIGATVYHRPSGLKGVVTAFSDDLCEVLTETGYAYEWPCCDLLVQAAGNANRLAMPVAQPIEKR